MRTDMRRDIVNIYLTIYRSLTRGFLTVIELHKLGHA